MIDDLTRLFPIFGASLLIFSILFSPDLRQILSHHRLVFLGSISFSMYLLHATLMRTVLAWVLYGLLPQPWQAEMQAEAIEGIENPYETHPFPFIWSVIWGIVFILWLGLLLCVSTIWRNWIDFYSIILSKWLEEVMAGKRFRLFQ